MARTKKTLKAAAVHLIEKMLELVSKTPKMYDQQHFPRPTEGNTCSTPFCAAGYIVMAKSLRKFNQLCAMQAFVVAVDWEQEALKALGLSNSDVNWAYIFGTTGSWPSKYRDMYEASYNEFTKSKADAKRVRAFKAYWKHLIKTDMAYAKTGIE